MAEKVKLSKDGTAIEFVQSENLPTSMKKFRHSNEIEGFYRFIYENDLQKEAFEILERIVGVRKVAKKAQKQEAALTKKTEQAFIKEQAALAIEAAKPAKVVAAKPAAKVLAKPTSVQKQVAKPAVKTVVKAVTKAKPVVKTKKK